MSTLVDKRCSFTFLLSKLVVWARMRGFNLAFGEGYVALTDAADGDYDGPHKKGGAHYTGLAVDLILYNPFGEPVTSGDDPQWKALGVKWESMNPLCRWGGRFGDANHFSIEHEGVK